MIAPRLGCQCHSAQSVTQSASSSAPGTFQLPSFFSRVVCNWAARGSLLETLLACSSFLPRVFEVISQLSHTCVKELSRGDKHRPGNSHWRISTERDASRMRWTGTCDPRPISASAVRHDHWRSGDVSRVSRVEKKWGTTWRLIGGVTTEINSPNLR